MASAHTPLPTRPYPSRIALAKQVNGARTTAAAAVTAAQSQEYGRRASLSSAPAESRSDSLTSQESRPSRSPQPPPKTTSEADRISDSSSKSKTPSTSTDKSSHASSAVADAPKGYDPRAHPPRKLHSQYPRGAAANHVEYILVASFDIDKGPVMEHQYPVAITGDENMLAELMLPDQAHVRNQDWTIFFLHKDTTQEEEEREARAKRRKRRQRRRNKVAAVADDGDDEDEEEEEEDNADEDDDANAENAAEQDGEELDDDESSGAESDGLEGPPLVYVLNLVNTKQDKTVKRGALVKAMAICTRHQFLHIYKPMLLLALDEYFKSPVPETLAMLYDALNAMDLSLMPRLSLLERTLLQASDNKDLFVEKFEQMIQMRIAQDRSNSVTVEPFDASRSPRRRAPGISRAGTKAYIEDPSKYAVSRDTREFESRIMYKGIPIPVKIPVAVMPETVGDFSLVKLIQNFSDAHTKSPQPFPLHAHLTTNGANTHPIIVLVNAMLTQKRVIFLGHNMPSGDVAEAVLAACALASGGVLRGFTRHAFPYTDLTKIDDLLNVPGFVAGVTNPTFELHPEWWDVLCDLPSGRIKISSKIEQAPITEGLVYFQQKYPSGSSIINASTSSSSSSSNNDVPGDAAFIQDILRSIAARHGERVVRAKWRDWVIKFTRIAGAFEESVYGSSALYIGGDGTEPAPSADTVGGRGYVWPDEPTKLKELAGNATRIEGWRNTRSYYSFIQDLAHFHTIRPLKDFDLHHMHDRLRKQRLSPSESRDIYLTLSKYILSYDEICLLLAVAPESHGGLFYVALGLFHRDRDVRLRTADLLERIAGHEAGQHWWNALSRFEKLAYARLKREESVREREAVGLDVEKRAS